MKLKEIATDIKTYIYLITIIGVVVAGIVGYGALPSRVDAVEEEVEATQEEVQDNRTNFEKYIAVQHVREEMQQQQTEQMIRLFEKLSE